MIISENRKKLFLSKIDIKSSDECWPWNGRTQDGYGRFKIKGKNEYCNRISYTIFKESIPKGNIVRHTCDNSICVNTGHLIMGTVKDNVRDCINRGRYFFVSKYIKENPQLHPSIIISKEQVKQIREMYNNCDNLDIISKNFNISKGYIYDITSNKRRKDSTYILNKRKRMKGENNPSSKLKESDIIKIRTMYPENTYKKISKIFNVSITAIYRIINKDIWSHI